MKGGEFCKILANLVIFSTISYFLSPVFGKGFVGELIALIVALVLTGIVERMFWYVLEPANAPKNPVMEFVTWGAIPCLLIFAFFNADQFDAHYRQHSHHHHSYQQPQQIVRKYEE